MRASPRRPMYQSARASLTHVPPPGLRDRIARRCHESGHRRGKTLAGADDKSPARARSFVRSVLDTWGMPADLTGDAAVIVSELATNAVLHTRSRCMVIVVAWTPGRVSISVTDQGPPPRQMLHPRADLDGTTGRGLALVAGLASRWGHHRTRTGMRVWAHIPVPPELEAVR